MHSPRVSSTNSYSDKIGCTCLRFFKCCERGYDTALSLVSFAATKTKSHLEEMYKTAVMEGQFQTSEFAFNFTSEPDPDDMEDGIDGKEKEDDPAENLSEVTKTVDHAGTDAFQTLRQMQSEAATLKSMITEEEAEAEPDHEEPEPQAEVDEFKGMPDETALKALFAADAGVADSSAPSETSIGSNELPSTLLEALALGSDFFNRIFRLCVSLRTGPAGCDSGFVQNHRSMRRCSKTLNWHQHHGDG